MKFNEKNISKKIDFLNFVIKKNIRNLTLKDNTKIKNKKRIQKINFVENKIKKNSIQEKNEINVVKILKYFKIIKVVNKNYTFTIKSIKSDNFIKFLLKRISNFSKILILETNISDLKVFLKESIFYFSY